MSDRAQQLADHLLGTCKGLDEGCEDLFGHDATFLSVAECLHLDDLVFECNECGWWCEIGDARENPSGDGDLCTDCAPDDD